MRGLVILAMLSGCAFRPSGDGAADDVGLPDGGEVTTFDGGPDGPALSVDAPAPGCPDGDRDNDGVCDAQDAWPCGATPPDQASTVTIGDNNLSASIANVSIGGGGRVMAVLPGATLSYTVSYTLRDNDVLCSSCQDQLEVGIVAGKRHGCIYDANPPQNQTQSGTSVVNMTAPTTPGLYTLRVRLARDFGCNAFGRDDWWISEPPADQAFGVICVR